MTRDRNAPQPAAETDALVTRTYRETADERAPDHLNRTVLKEAASAARPRYSRLRSWTRPMAWAATVMLTVALVLEVTKVPTPQGITFDEPAVKIKADAPEPDSTDTAPANPSEGRILEDEVLEEAIRPATPPGGSSSTAVVTRLQAEALNANAEQAVPESTLQKRQHAAGREGPVGKQDLAAPAMHVDEFKLKDADMLRRADDMARMRSGENKTLALPSSAPVAADGATLGAVAVSTEAQACDESAVATPETWLECIERLEAAGRADEAGQQRELLQAAFPEFKP